MNQANFLASFPPIMSAIKIAGNGDGMRIQLDIPESEMAEAVKLLQWRNTAVMVSIVAHCKTEVINALEDRDKRQSKRTPADR